MKKNENVFITALQAIVRFFLKVFYRKRTFRRKAMQEINFLAPKSDYLVEYKKRRKSAWPLSVKSSKPAEQLAPCMQKLLSTSFFLLKSIHWQCCSNKDIIMAALGTISISRLSLTFCSPLCQIPGLQSVRAIRQLPWGCRFFIIWPLRTVSIYLSKWLHTEYLLVFQATKEIVVIVFVY